MRLVARRLEDHQLGTLIWEDDFKQWEGEICIAPFAPCALSVFSREDPERPITVPVRAAIARAASSERTYRERAANELLKTYESEWSDEPQLTTQQFMNRWRLISVEVHESGYAELSYDAQECSTTTK